jgi:amino acid permease
MLKGDPRNMTNFIDSESSSSADLSSSPEIGMPSRNHRSAFDAPSDTQSALSDGNISQGQGSRRRLQFKARQINMMSFGTINPFFSGVILQGLVLASASSINREVPYILRDRSPFLCLSSLWEQFPIRYRYLHLLVTICLTRKICLGEMSSYLPIPGGVFTLVTRILNESLVWPHIS